VARALLLLAVVCVLSGCGGASSVSASRKETVVAGFYPLAWAVERIGRGRLDVVNLTPAGAEPHDLELTPREVERVHDASYLVYVGGGFQPALEEAVASRTRPALDVVSQGDPHVWLDPPAFARVVREIGAALHRRAAARVTARQVLALDVEYRHGLAECRRRALVTTHAAFGRLAARYGLTAIPLAGRSPESEPGPRELERIVSEVRASGATTVFTEPLVSARLAETVAREARVGVATLDPVEGLTAERLAAGDDYLSVMRSNLRTLRRALGCR